jgi:hypothetical protein
MNYRTFNNLLIASLILLTGFSSISVAQQAIKPGKNFRLDGVTLTSPEEPGWRLVRSDRSEVRFERRGAGSAAKVLIRSVPADKTVDKEKLLASLEARKSSELENLENLKRDSLHLNFTNFKDTPCLQYDSIQLNQAATPRDFEYYNVFGYLCVNPFSKGMIVEMEFSNYSGARGLSDTDVKLFRRLFDSVKFTNTKN